jgi:hypothetical protein
LRDFLFAFLPVFPYFFSYLTYESTPELLKLAMNIGWTRNVVILEANLTLEEQAWYLRATARNG